MTADTAAVTSALDGKKIFYNRFLLIVAGLGGLLYGVDVGIIAGAFPYLEATSGFNRGQLSIVVAAVLLGSVISPLFAGLLAVLSIYQFTKVAFTWYVLLGTGVTFAVGSLVSRVGVPQERH